MATLEQAIYSILHGDTTIVSLVSTRITPLLVAQEMAMPAITYQKVSDERLQTLSGDIGEGRPDYQINCLASSYLGALTLEAAVKSALVNYSGTVDGIVIKQLVYSGSRDMATDATDTKVQIFGRSIDVEFWYED